MTHTIAQLRVPAQCLTDLTRMMTTRFLRSSSRGLGSGSPAGTAKTLILMAKKVKEVKAAKTVETMTSIWTKQTNVESIIAMEWRTGQKLTSVGIISTIATMEPKRMKVEMKEEEVT